MSRKMKDNLHFKISCPKCGKEGILGSITTNEYFKSSGATGPNFELADKGFYEEDTLGYDVWKTITCITCPGCQFSQEWEL